MSGMTNWGCLAATLLLAGCAANPERTQSAATTSRQCFFASSATSFAVVDSRTVNVRVGASDFFRIDLFSQCPDLSFASRVSLRTSTSASICAGSGMGVTLVHRTGPRQRRCSVRSITPLTAEEVQALSGRERPM